MTQRKKTGRRPSKGDGEAGSELPGVEVGEMPTELSAARLEEVREKFQRSIFEFETTPEVLPFTLLQESGFPLVAPEDVGDDDLRSTLHALAEGLAGIGLYLYNTDHLSDRELYERLWDEVLIEPTILMPHDRDFACHVDMSVRDGEDETLIYLRYYADEDERRHWKESCPDDQLPPHEDPPFDRDRSLPAPYRWKTN